MMSLWLGESTRHTRILGDHVEIGPADAAAHSIPDEQFAVVSSRIATVTVRASITDDLLPGIVGMDQGWRSRLFVPQGKDSPEVRGVMANMLVWKDGVDELARALSLDGTWTNGPASRLCLWGVPSKLRGNVRLTRPVVSEQAIDDIADPGCPIDARARTGPARE
jgi:anaerobic selenocysteine-containing dehydrogenase